MELLVSEVVLERVRLELLLLEELVLLLVRLLLVMEAVCVLDRVLVVVELAVRVLELEPAPGARC